MKHTTSLLLFLCLLPGLFAQQVDFSPSDWQDPAVFEKNQTRPHAKMVSFPAVEQAIAMDPVQSPFFMSLDGKWKFLVVENPASVPEGFWKPGFDTGNWDYITVPANWEMEGYEHPKFRNIAMTIETDPPFVPDYYNPVGCYKRSFTVPPGWDNRAVMLRFEGVKSASYVWVNGERAGYNQGGFEPAEYDITSFLKPGENEIAVKVLRYSDGAFLENQDMWRLSGIFRSVNLISRPGVHIHDYYVATMFDKAYRDAEMLLDIDIQNLTVADQDGYSVEINLLDEDQKPVPGIMMTAQPGAVKAGEVRTLNFSVPVTAPKQWSAEKPNLYTLVMTLRSPDGSVEEVVAKRMGFRQTEIRDGAIWVNGIRVKFNGVNSHMHHPVHGHTVPLETMREDLIIMKQYNINLVRTSHYPPSPEYLDLANELGMYIVTDAGNECHDNEWLSQRPEWEAQFVDRAVKMVYRDRNHPSVVFWSAGNEAGSGNNIKAMIEKGKEIDPHRPMWMYGGNRFYIPFEDIVGPRYWKPLQIKNLAEDRVLDPTDQRPSFMDEYLAATGNGLGGLDEYWEFIWKYPRLTGGAIWDWVSPGVTMPVLLTTDRSPLKNDPAVMGRPVFVPGKEGRAIRLSGHDDWVEFYRHPRLDLAGTALTVEFWVKPEENIQPNTFITKGSHQFGILQPNTSGLEFFVQTNSRNSVIVEVPASWYGNWHHVAGIYTGEKIELYINYEKVGEADARGNIRNTPYPVCIGRDAELHDQGELSGRLSVCTIDEVRIYDSALTISELRGQSPAQANMRSVASIGFEETRNEDDFFSVGLGGRTYGIIWPDRSVQPEIHQIKKSAQPVLIEAIDPENGQLKITNRHNFTNLKELQAKWEIMSEGEITGSGYFSVTCAPGETAEVTVPGVKGVPDGGKERWLTLSFLLREDQSWADAGHEIAWEQFNLPAGLSPADRRKIILADSQPKSSLPDVTYQLSEERIDIAGENFRYILDAGTGSFLSIVYNGTEMLEKPGFGLTVWRIPIANDMDPWGARQYGSTNITPGLGRSIDNQMRTLGLESLDQSVYDIKAGNTQTGEVTVSIVIYSVGTTRNSGFEEHRNYGFSHDGTISLNHKIIPHGNMPPLLPKIGMQVFMPDKFSNIEWYGRGPFETYPDRKTGARNGFWSSTVDDEFVPYIIPQDHGNKTDTRWVRISSDEESGLLVSSPDLFNFSVHGYSTDNLTRAVHQFQLESAGYITLNLDYEVTGVGGTAVRTLAKYQVKPSVKEYSLVIRPFSRDSRHAYR